jgi:anti-anti-sigma regulatory factor
MTLRIEAGSKADKTVLHLIGQIESEHVEGLKWQISLHRSRVLDLHEVKLVDADVVRFLADCEAEGIEVLHCSRYIREWISREQSIDDRDS